MRTYPLPRKTLVLVCLALLGWIRGLLWQPVVSFSDFHVPINICGTVGFPTEQKLHGRSLIIENLNINKQKVWGRLKIWTSKAGIYVGDRLCFKSELSPIKNFGILGEFDFERFFLKQKIWGKARLKGKVQIQKKHARYPIQSIREKYGLFLNQFKSRGVLKALTLGMKSELHPDVKESFIQSGMYHLLVVSGLHVALLLWLVWQILFFFLSRSEFLMLRFNIQKLLVGLCFLVLFYFYFFSGAAISIGRASIMAGVVMLSLWHSRPKAAMLALIWAAALILNLMPSSLLDPSFQLSFMAVLAMTMAQKLFWHKSKILALFFSTFMVNLVTLPIVLFYFHRFSVVALLSNMVAIPYVSFVLLPLSMVATLIFFVTESFARGFITLVEPCYFLFESMGAFFAAIKGSSIYLMAPSVFQIGIIYSALAVIFYFLMKKRRKKALCSVVLASLLLFISFEVPKVFNRLNQNLKVSFLSIGQGDSTWVQFPKGKTMLVDAGGIWGAFNVGQRLLAPYLWRKGTAQIDILVLTHADFDHIQGALFLLEHFKVGEIWISQWQFKSKTYEELLVLAEKNSINVFVYSAEFSKKRVSGVEIQFLNPPNPFGNYSNNNQSMVLRLKYHKFSMLLTGDIEKAVERGLSKKDIQSTILKVAHHGSKTSSSFAFLKAVSPQAAIISCGYKNRHQHPSPVVLGRLKGLGVAVYRTDLQGTIELETDGVSFKVGHDSQGL